MINPFVELTDKLEEISSKLDQLIEKQNEPTMLTFLEACEFLNLSKQCVYQKVHNKSIPFHKRDARLWFDKGELIKWLKGNGNEQKRPRNE